MNLLEQFQTIRESAEHGLASALHFEAEGAELVRSFRPNERLILLGGGNIAQPLCRYAADLGFSVIVADDLREPAALSRSAHGVLRPVRERDRPDRYRRGRLRRGHHARTPL